MATERTLRILSLGAGVQSTTLLMMACEGELAIDHAIFADTQGEPDHVYVHLKWLSEQAAKAGIPVDIVTTGDLAEDFKATDKRASSIPLFVVGPSGKPGMVFRQCTRDYKVRPVRRRARELTGGKPVEMLMGISLDEAQRMKHSNVKWITNVYPLIDRRMTRDDCLTWMQERGYPEPPKSACWFCPYASNQRWREIRDNDPSSWGKAVEFDEAIRHHPRFSGAAYLHRSLQPLAIAPPWCDPDSRRRRY